MAKWGSFGGLRQGVPLGEHATCKSLCKGLLGEEESERAKGHLGVGLWEGRTRKQEEQEQDRIVRGTFKGCTCRITDGGKAPGGRWWYNCLFQGWLAAVAGTNNKKKEKQQKHTEDDIKKNFIHFGRNTNYSYYRNYYGSSSKIQKYLWYNPAIPSLDTYAKAMKSVCQNDRCIKVYCNS